MGSLSERCTIQRFKQNETPWTVVHHDDAVNKLTCAYVHAVRPAVPKVATRIQLNGPLRHPRPQARAAVSTPTAALESLGGGTESSSIMQTE